MAETLGSLVDKLSIKCIREHFLKKMREEENKKFTNEEIDERLDLLVSQKEQLFGEVQDFIVLASEGKIPLREEKLKMYNKIEDVGKIGGADTVAKAIDGLVSKNLEIWNLEDQARREDVDAAFIGGIKRKIDPANQQRNDFIDRVDELLDGILNKRDL